MGKFGSLKSSGVNRFCRLQRIQNQPPKSKQLNTKAASSQEGKKDPTAQMAPARFTRRQPPSPTLRSSPIITPRANLISYSLPIIHDSLTPQRHIQISRESLQNPTIHCTRSRHARAERFAPLRLRGGRGEWRRRCCRRLRKMVVAWRGGCGGMCCWGWRWGSSCRCSSPPPASPPPSSPAEVMMTILSVGLDDRITALRNSEFPIIPLLFFFCFFFFVLFIWSSSSLLRLALCWTVETSRSFRDKKFRISFFHFF